jgi:hypothetical protein
MGTLTQLVDKIVLNVPKVLSYGATAFNFVEISKNGELEHMVYCCHLLVDIVERVLEELGAQTHE